jgi:hypothetical protein
MSEAGTTKEAPALPVCEIGSAATNPVDIVLSRHAERAITPASEATIAAVHSAEDPAAMMERVAQGMEAIRTTLICFTTSQDWVRRKGRDREPDRFTLKKSGAMKIAAAIGLSLDVYPRDERGLIDPIRDEDGDEVRFTLWANAAATFFQRRIDGISASRSTSESFAGRGAVRGTTKLVKESDLREAVVAKLWTKAVCAFVGIGALTASELDAVGVNTAEVAQGQGFGSAAERRRGGKQPETGAKTTDDPLAVAKAELGEAILGCVNGDKGAARGLLSELTAQKATSIGDLKTMDAVEAAEEALLKHPTFGT